MDSDLKPQPGFAESWSLQNGGKTYAFKIHPGLTDHGGESVTAEKLAACLEQYREGKPYSVVRAGFPAWKGTRHQGDLVFVDLDRADPYLPQNASLLRYFRSAGKETPCAEPLPGAPIIGSGWFQMRDWDPRPTNELRLVPVDPHYRQLHFLFVREDNTRVLKLLRGEVDLAQNSLSLSKSNWIRSQHTEKFRVFERDGVNVSFLSFNLKDPVLSRLDVRRALALSIDRDEIVKHKLFRFATVAGSFLSPLIEESQQSRFLYDPAAAEVLLDSAGYPRNAKGTRLHLKFKTTPIRDGIEMAFMLQGMFRKIGVELTLEVVEPAVFQASVRKGAYQLSLGRWIGVADGSILHRALHSKSILSGNRANYSDPQMDAWLDQAISEPDKEARIALMRKVQTKMSVDLPYFPLWYWNNAIIVRRSLSDEVKKIKISLSGAFEPLIYIGAQ
jgi:peptide/nickel transport system substrate-binding protein